MKRTNILFVMPQMGMGGSERLVHTLASRLDPALFGVSIAWMSGQDVLQEFRDLKVPLHYVPKERRVDLQTMRAMARLVEDNGIDVVNAQHFMPAIYCYYGCKIAARKALVFTTHSRWETEEIPFKWRVAGGYLLRRMDALVGVAPDVSSAVRSVFHTSEQQTVTIENGVDTEAFSPARDAGKLRQDLGFGAEDVVVGIVANLKTVKNHIFLLEAFSRIRQSAGEAKLLIVGQGFDGESDNTEAELRRFIEHHGLGEKVLLLGYRKDIAELLSAMDVFCLVSLREGLPIGLIEAMATGLPVIGTDVSGIRDVISEGEDGLLVELGNVFALENALRDLIGNSARRIKMGQAGREKAIRKYSLQRCVRDYERMFLSLVDRGARASSGV